MGMIGIETRQKLFRSVASRAPRMPEMRGRSRPFLALFDLLRLNGTQTMVEATLAKPVPYKAVLDCDSWLQRIAFLTGAYEAATTELLARLAGLYPKDAAIVDIGANVGLISIPVAILSRRNVFAVEAVKDNYEALLANIARNALSPCVTPIHAALGDVAGKTVDIQVEGDRHIGEGTGTSNVIADGSDYVCARTAITLETLDGLIASRRVTLPIAAIKIDTDGYDLKILSGAQALLQSQRPVILGEFAPICLGWHGQTRADVAQFCDAIHYVTRPWSDCLLLLPREHEDAVKSFMT